MRISNDIDSCKTCVYKQLLFGDLNNKEYELINKTRTEKIYRRGEVIVKENDPIESFLYLRTGLVKLYKTDEHGKDHLKNKFKIVTKTVKAKDLYTDGNSLSEWGYDPQ